MRKRHDLSGSVKGRGKRKGKKSSPHRARLTASVMERKRRELGEKEPATGRKELSCLREIFSPRGKGGESGWGGGGGGKREKRNAVVIFSQKKTGCIF